jgi:hypothetical protein
MTGAPFSSRPRLRLVEKPPWPCRLEVQIAVADGRAPYGRSRIFRLSENAIEELVDTAERMERRA